MLRRRHDAGAGCHSSDGVVPTSKSGSRAVGDEGRQPARVYREDARRCVAFASGRYDQLYRSQHTEHYLDDGRERQNYTSGPPPQPPWPHESSGWPRAGEAGGVEERIVGSPVELLDPPPGAALAEAAHKTHRGVEIAKEAPPSGENPVGENEVGLRVLQWNINCLNGPGTGFPTATDVLGEVMSHSPDVIILNEFGSGRYRGPEQRGRHHQAKASESAINKLATLLLRAGFAIHHSTVLFPTVIATRHRVVESEAFELSASRGAIRVGLVVTRGDTSKEITIFGTHLDHMHADVRRTEMEVLLKAVGRSSQAILIAGDFNEQRAADYVPADWAQICSGKAKRGENRIREGDVAGLLTAERFVCCYDDLDGPRNWPTGDPPPPTHWSSTVIDFAYTRGAVRGVGVYVSASNLSDHRPVITDWVLE